MTGGECLSCQHSQRGNLVASRCATNDSYRICADRNNKRTLRTKSWSSWTPNDPTPSTSEWPNFRLREPSKRPSSRWTRPSSTEKASRYWPHLQCTTLTRYVWRFHFCRNCWRCCRRMRNGPRSRRLRWPIRNFRWVVLSSFYWHWPPSPNSVPGSSSGSSNQTMRTWRRCPIPEKLFQI